MNCFVCPTPARYNCLHNDENIQPLAFVWLEKVKRIHFDTVNQGQNGIIRFARPDQDDSTMNGTKTSHTINYRSGWSTKHCCWKSNFLCLMRGQISLQSRSYKYVTASWFTGLTNAQSTRKPRCSQHKIHSKLRCKEATPLSANISLYHTK